MPISALEDLLCNLEVRVEEIFAGEPREARERLSGRMGDTVILAVKGVGSFQSENLRVPIAGGSMIIVPAHLTYFVDDTRPVVPIGKSDSAVQEQLVVVCGSMNVTVSSGLGAFEALREPLIEQLRDETSPFLVEALLLEAASTKAGTTTLLSSLMKQIITIIIRNHTLRNGLASNMLLPLLYPRFRAPLQVMIGQPAHPHTLDSLAVLAGMSRSRFASNFVEVLGVSPMAFLQSVRLRAAARLLRGSQLPIKAITADIGFTSRSHFSRAFRSMFGVDPTRFRNHTSATALKAVRHEETETIERRQS